MRFAFPPALGRALAGLLVLAVIASILPVPACGHAMARPEPSATTARPCHAVDATAPRVGEHRSGDDASGTSVRGVTLGCCGGGGLCTRAGGTNALLRAPELTAPSQHPAMPHGSQVDGLVSSISSTPDHVPLA